MFVWFGLILVCLGREMQHNTCLEEEKGVDVHDVVSFGRVPLARAWVRVFLVLPTWSNSAFPHLPNRTVLSDWRRCVTVDCRRGREDKPPDAHSRQLVVECACVRVCVYARVCACTCVWASVHTCAGMCLICA